MSPGVGQRPTQARGNSSEKGDDARQNRQEVRGEAIWVEAASSRVATRPISTMIAVMPSQNAIRLSPGAALVVSATAPIGNWGLVGHPAVGGWIPEQPDAHSPNHVGNG